MKHLALDWGAFLSGLETWEQLSPADRQTFLELPPNRLIRTVEVGAPAKTLVRSGLLAPVGDGRNLRVAKPFLPLHRGLNGIGLLPVFAEPDEATLESYLTLHFSADECGKLIAQGGRYSNRRQTVARVTTVEWLESFREAKDPIAWEKKHSGGGGLLCFAEPPVAPALRAIIDYLLATDSPCPLRDLARELSRPSSPAQPAQPALGLSRPVLGKALYAGLRYLLLFPSLFQGFHPVVGLWPPLAKRLHQPVPSAPSPVEPEETCPADFAVFDMIAVLAACAVEPQRVRSNDLSLFARARDTLAALLSPLPEWVHEVYAASPQDRAERAAWVLRRLDLLHLGQDDLKRPQLLVSSQGSRWLGLSAKRRLQFLLDEIKKNVSHSSHDPGLTFLPYDPSFYPSRNFDEAKAVVAAFADLRPGAFYDLFEFFKHRAQVRNPLIELSRSGKGHYWLPSSPEQLEPIWMERLLEFLGQRLLLVGGVQFGWKANRACFAITEVGLYFLGAADDFEVPAEAPAEVVLQPNFEIVFLSPSIATEAALARFAQRRGTGVGTLFRITKSAIFGAAAAGMNAEQVLATLRQAAAKGVPDNVAREITGWFAQTRRLTVRASLLLHCQDGEAARRVLAAGGKSVVPLTETVVELLEPKGKAALLRKLREIGVFLGGE